MVGFRRSFDLIPALRMRIQAGSGRSR
jgi:hypothetical protein